MGVRPVPHKITQPFGANPTARTPHPVFGNYQPGGHAGTDFGCPTDTPVVAIEDMVITWADWGHKFPTNGDNSHNGWASRYYLVGANLGIGVIGETGRGAYVFAHLNRTDLNPGDRVKAGDVIGYSGSTGLSTAPHLHVEWIPTPAQYGNALYGRVDALVNVTEPYRINGAPVATATEKVKAKVTPTPKPIVAPEEYRLETNRATPSSAYTPGRTTKVTDVVIHHYGDDSATYESSVNWLTRPGASTSAHFVVDQGRVARIVKPTDTAWHAGDWPVNTRSIGIENHPIWTQAREDTLVQLCADLEEEYGGLRYTVHSDHTATACPGRWKARVPHIIDGINRELARRKATPAPVKPPAAAVATYHVVKPGEYLSLIAARYGVTEAQVLAWNKYIKDPNYLAVGDRVRVK